MALHRKPVLPIEFDLLSSSDNSVPADPPDAEAEVIDIDSIVCNMANIRRELFDKAAENIQSAQQRYKADYDKRRADPMVHLLMIKIKVT